MPQLKKFESFDDNEISYLRRIIYHTGGDFEAAADIARISVRAIRYKVQIFGLRDFLNAVRNGRVTEAEVEAPARESGEETVHESASK